MQRHREVVDSGLTVSGRDRPKPLSADGEGSVETAQGGGSAQPIGPFEEPESSTPVLKVGTWRFTHARKVPSQQDFGPQSQSHRPPNSRWYHLTTLAELLSKRPIFCMGDDRK